MERRISNNEDRMINRIENSTLAKLTCEEAQMLIRESGFGYYKGDLKTRYNGMKRVSEDGVTFTFVGRQRDVEFTKLADKAEKTYWVARVYNKEYECYEEYPMGITGVYFIR